MLARLESNAFSPPLAPANASYQQLSGYATHHDRQPANIYRSMQGGSMKTGLGIVHSNHLETLADALVEWCRREPISPLEEEVVLVQRSEEHTSELQSRGHLVCRLLL